jgi:Ala-tRNA(Pro) deacylase
MQLDIPTSSADELLLLLDRNNLPYDIAEHEPVFTIEDALAAPPDVDGIKTKNVFLRDAKGTRHCRRRASTGSARTGYFTSKSDLQ